MTGPSPSRSPERDLDRRISTRLSPVIKFNTIDTRLMTSQRCKKLFSEADIPPFLNAPCACGEPSGFMTGNTRRHFRIENPVLKTAQQRPNSRGAKGRVSIQRIPAFLESLRLFLGVLAPSLF